MSLLTRYQVRNPNAFAKQLRIFAFISLAVVLGIRVLDGSWWFALIFGAILVLGLFLAEVNAITDIDMTTDGVITFRRRRDPIFALASTILEIRRVESEGLFERPQMHLKMEWGNKHIVMRWFDGAESFIDQVLDANPRVAVIGVDAH